jgi:hypothetical protein
MTEQQEERLRGAVRAWLSAADDLTRAAGDGDDLAAVVELADRATLAKLAFHQTLIDLGWTPPATPPPAPPPPAGEPGTGRDPD